jgi:hypothetical protein
MHKKERLYIDDPELGRIPLISSDDTPEEKAAMERDVQERIDAIGRIMGCTFDEEIDPAKQENMRNDTASV